MNIAFITYFTSLIGIVAMIGLKYYEVRTQKRSILSRFVEKTDYRIQYAYRKIRLFISYFNRKSAVALVQWIAYHVLSWARRGYIWLHRKAHAHPPSKKVIDMVRGKGDVGNIGGASFYLKKISEENAG